MFNLFFPCCTPQKDIYARNVDNNLMSGHNKRYNEYSTTNMNSLDGYNDRNTLTHSKNLKGSLKTDDRADKDDNKDEFMFNTFVKKTTKINGRDGEPPKNLKQNAAFRMKPGIIMPPPPSIVNNINSININIHQEVIQAPNLKKNVENHRKDNHDVEGEGNAGNDNGENNKKCEGGEDSKANENVQISPARKKNSFSQLVKNSTISFSNILVKRTNSSNIMCDTEILNTCEIIFIGEIFGGKEITIDRLGIKMPYGDLSKRRKKDSVIRFGILKDQSESKEKEIQALAQLNNITDAIKFNDSASSSSLINIKRENSLDFVLNFSKNKHQKILTLYEKAKENSPLIEEKGDKSITLFTVKYNSGSEFFEFFSALNDISVELLLNFDFNLHEGRTYSILTGTVTLLVKFYKNSKEESVLEVQIKEVDGKKYTFNPNTDKMPVTIGRANCSINISNISVSKTHSQIKYAPEKDEFIITDCKSTNGTYLQMKGSLAQLQLSRDYQFRVAESRFAVKYVNTEA